MNDVAWHTIETMGHRSSREIHKAICDYRLRHYPNRPLVVVEPNVPFVGNDRSPWQENCAEHDDREGCEWVPPTYVLVHSCLAWDGVELCRQYSMVRAFIDLLAQGLPIPTELHIMKFGRPKQTCLDEVSP